MSKGIRVSPKHGVNPMLGQCPLCAGESNELFLLGRLPDDAEAPRQGVVPGMSQPCDTCKKYMEMGVLLIVCKDGTDQKNPYRTGEQHVVTVEAAERIFSDSLKGHRVLFIEETVARTLGLPIPEMKGDDQ